VREIARMHKPIPQEKRYSSSLVSAKTTPSFVPHSVMLSAFLVLPHGRLPLSSPRLVEAWPVQPPPLVWLACRLGNRPAGRSGDWRPVALSGLPPAGLPHTRIRLRKKKTEQKQGV